MGLSECNKKDLLHRYPVLTEKKEKLLLNLLIPLQ